MKTTDAGLALLRKACLVDARRKQHRLSLYEKTSNDMRVIDALLRVVKSQRLHGSNMHLHAPFEDIDRLVKRAGRRLRRQSAQLRLSAEAIVRHAR